MIRPIIEIDVSLEDLLSNAFHSGYSDNGYTVSGMLIDIVWYSIVRPTLNEEEEEAYTDYWVGDIDFTISHPGMLHFSYWIDE
jgi:hypothetical protein